MNLLESLLLGIVEGITEYLPISSTGHLILVSSLIGLTGEAVKRFEVVIQFGAILAVLGLYRERVKQILNGIFRKDRIGFNLFINLFVAFLPSAIIGFFLHKNIKEYLFYPFPVASALAIGGVVMIIADILYERNGREKITIESLQLNKSLAIGFIQCFALWPGVSRSMATILGGLLIGLDRKDSAEFSFLLALPTLGLATLFDLYNGGTSFITDIGFLNLAVGLIVSGIVAAIVIKGFVSWLTKGGLAPFGWYRLIIAILILLFWKT